MRLAAIALGCGIAFTATAALADDPMADTYANTIVAKDSKGMSSSFLFNADGTYTIKAARHGEVVPGGRKSSVFQAQFGVNVRRTVSHTPYACGVSSTTAPAGEKSAIGPLATASWPTSP